MSLLLYLWNDLPTCCFADSLIFKVAILLGIGLDSAGAWELQLTLQNSGSCRLYFVESTKTLREGFCTWKITNTSNRPIAYPLCNHKASTFWVSHFLHLPSADKGNEGLTLGRANKWGLCVWGNRSFLKIGRSRSHVTQRKIWRQTLSPGDKNKNFQSKNSPPKEGQAWLLLHMRDKSINNKFSNSSSFINSTQEYYQTPPNTRAFLFPPTNVHI